jgi:RHS repeat-associated protein
LPLLLDDGEHSYLYGPTSTPLAQIDTLTGEIEYLHADLVGSVRLLTDAEGDDVGAAVFDPYGRVASRTGIASAFGYSGNWTDPDTGFVYLRARDYDPKTGQFIQVDPAVDNTRQPYAYAGNNPLQLTDPTGFVPCSIVAFGCIDFGAMGILLGGYSYEYDHRIGPTWLYGNATEAMKVFQEHPADIFPFEIAGCATLTTGAECQLVNALNAPPMVDWLLSATGEVEVEATSTSVTFTVTKVGYFDPVGSQIMFTTYECNGDLFLRQSTDVPLFVHPAVRAGVGFGGAKTTWSAQADNFREVLYASRIA